MPIQHTMTDMTALPSSTRLRYSVVAACAMVTLLLLMWPQNMNEMSWTATSSWRRPLSPREQAANSTLGFQRILALSAGPSWRTRGLQAAAKLTGLDIDMPPQPYNPDDLVKAFSHMGPDLVSHPSEGSARAWVSHLDLIKYVVASGFESALILEDDVDWDTSIKNQVQLASDAIRNFTSTPDNDSRPYGLDWDILWLGHCGEVTEPGFRWIEYEDPTRMPYDLYAGWNTRSLQNIGDTNRAIHWAHTPVCTFGYAINQFSAQKVLGAVGRGRDEAFDIALQHECVHGKLRCLVVNPELMHHYNPPDGYDYVSEVFEGDGKGHSAGEATFEHVRGTTANMVHSARCAALFQNTCPQPPLGQ